MNEPNFHPTDSTHPNNPVTYQKPPPQTARSPLMQTLSGVWHLPWPRKPIGKPGKQGQARTTRSGVHRLGQKHKKGY